MSESRKSNLPPALWPNKVKYQGTQATLRGPLRFLLRYGYWPRLAELSRFLGSTKSSVYWYVDENVKSGLLEMHGSRSKREIRCSPRGFAALSQKPVAPFKSRRRVGKSEREAIKAKVVAEVIREMKALNA